MSQRLSHARTSHQHSWNLAFQPVILSQGSPEQVQDLGERAKKLAIIGAYAQTELGHGSEVSRLETTATYLPETEEFEIHSPTLTSTKWWVGGLAKTATHAVVQAQLILPGGKSKGPHLFIVQLRSLGKLSMRYTDGLNLRQYQRIIPYERVLHWVI